MCNEHLEREVVNARDVISSERAVVRDVVLLDGNLAHGVSSLCGVPGCDVGPRTQLQRFSLVMFSRFQREKMKRRYEAMWCEDWRPAMKEGHVWVVF